MIGNEFSVPGRNGYSISILSNVNDAHSSILLCLHGFCGDKNSSVIAALMENLDQYGVGVLTFDWPAHGNSIAKDEDLTVENCLSDIDAVLECIQDKWVLPVSCFATSFGGYLAMLYRNKHLKAFEKTVLRSPALKMAQTFLSFCSADEIERFQDGEALTMGFDRKMQISYSFYESLMKNNAYEAPVSNPEQLLILQGDCDDIVMPYDTATYAERNGIRLVWFRGSDHRYKKSGDLNQIIKLTRDFLLL